MTDSQTVQFYSSIRSDEAALARIGKATSEAQLVELVLDEAKRRGYAATPELVRQGIGNIGSIIQSVPGDELNEFELEMVSGGWVSNETCYSPNGINGCGGNSNSSLPKRT